MQESGSIVVLQDPVEAPAKLLKILGADRRLKCRLVSSVGLDSLSEGRIGTMRKAACRSNLAMRTPLSILPRRATALLMVE